jgi:dihydroorotate dehydrogenase (fumarate)
MRDIMVLTTPYMGIELKNPLIASASPLTGDLDTLRRLEDAGAAAVVLPSLFQEEIEAEARRYETQVQAGAESFPEARTYLPAHTIEHTGPERYLALVRNAVDALDIPVIGSLNGTTNEGWIGYARQIEQAGAQGLELNVYFIPTELSMAGASVEQRHIEILDAVRTAVAIPIAVKLSPYFSALGHVAQQFDRAGAAALVLFNRLYQPDIDLARLRLIRDLELSSRHEIRLPLLWISVLSGRVRASLAASTGVESAEEIVKYLLAGADVVMTTSALLRRGPSYIENLLTELRSWLSARDFNSLEQVRGLLSHQRAANAATPERDDYLAILQGYNPQHMVWRSDHGDWG